MISRNVQAESTRSNWIAQASDLLRSLVIAFVFITTADAIAAEAPAKPPTFYHLRQGVTFYVVNPAAAPFEIVIDLKDINTYCQGAQTAMFKVYDPDGSVVHNEEIADDGITDGGYDAAWAGWDHELWARGAVRELGAEPLFRWETFSNPLKLAKIRGEKRTVPIKSGKQGVYQVQIVGCDDHFVEFGTAPELKFGVLGHPDFLAGHGDQFRTSYLYVPEDTIYMKEPPQHGKLTLWLIEHAYPHTRKLTLSLGDKPLDLTDTAWHSTSQDKLHPRTQQKAAPPIRVTKSLTAGQALGRVEADLSAIKSGAVLKLTNEGQGDFLIRVSGVPPIFCPDEPTARAIAGGLIPTQGGPPVSFAFQKELWDSIKNLKKEDFTIYPGPGQWSHVAPEELAKIRTHVWNVSNDPKAVDASLKHVEVLLAAPGPFNVLSFMEKLSVGIPDLTTYYLYPFKGNELYHNKALRNVITVALIKQWLKFRGGEVIYEPVELNVAYAQGFHWDNWEPLWTMKDELDPTTLKAFQKGVEQIAQRMFYANGLELVLSNGRTTVPLNLYHAYLITGNEKLKDLSKRYFRRMVTALDGPHSGWSNSGYFREHFGADGGYCTYPLYQLGRLYNISGDPEVLDVVDRMCRWMCYVTLPNGAGSIGPTSWNARIAMSASEHMWGEGYKYYANKSPWAAILYRRRHTTPNFYDVPEPVYNPPLANDKKVLVLAHVTRNIPAKQPLPAESDKPFFDDVGNGHEFFAVRRGNYYGLIYAGKRPPFWMDTSLGGANSFNGGGLAGLYIHGGAGTVIIGRVNKEYGWPIEDWNELTVPAAMGETSDGRVFNTGISRNVLTWDKSAWAIRTTGEVVSVPINYERSYQFGEASIAASIAVRDADLNEDVFQYRTIFRKPHSGIRFAWEVVPCMAEKTTSFTALDASGKSLGEISEKPLEGASTIEVANGRGGIRLKLDKPRAVKLSHVAEHTHDRTARGVQIKIADELEPGLGAELKYEIVPYSK